MVTVRFFLAFLLPSVAIGLLEGATRRYWLACLLTLLGWIPGVVYALIVLYRHEARPFPVPLPRRPSLRS
ncbi:MAG TPA: YqaE/Pmp3 family membrane protein [Polyangiales bacterium]|nr:YqaE/Pmp3 family membrane protein [Polyangiales bacterium]